MDMDCILQIFRYPRMRIEINLASLKDVFVDDLVDVKPGIGGGNQTTGEGKLKSEATHLKLKTYYFNKKIGSNPPEVRNFMHDQPNNLVHRSETKHEHGQRTKNLNHRVQTPANGSVDAFPDPVLVAVGVRTVAASKEP